jgi:5-methylcytosine-specific restriction endonuclease McrA
VINHILLAELIEVAPPYVHHLERQPIPTLLHHEILQRDENKCRICGSTKRIKVHHISPQGPSTPENLIAICDICHEYVSKQLRTKGYKYYRPR